MQAEAEMYRAMWERSMDDCLERLVRTGSDGLMYVGIIAQVTAWSPAGALRNQVASSGSHWLAQHQVYTAELGVPSSMLWALTAPCLSSAFGMRATSWPVMRPVE